MQYLYIFTVSNSSEMLYRCYFLFLSWTNIKNGTWTYQKNLTNAIWILSPVNKSQHWWTATGLFWFLFQRHAPLHLNHLTHSAVSFYSQFFVLLLLLLWLLVFVTLRSCAIAQNDRNRKHFYSNALEQTKLI